MNGDFKMSLVEEAFFRRPWAITTEKYQTLAKFLILRSQGIRTSKEEIQAITAKANSRAESRPAREVGFVAVIPIHGVIVHRETEMTRESGLTTVQGISRQLDRAFAEKELEAVALDFDTPGGETAGIIGLAEQIRKLRSLKPIFAMVNGMCGSAGFHLASQATRISMTSDSSIGSVGVVMMHKDISKALEKEGVKVTLVSAGKFKTEGNPFEKLSTAARAEMQASIDESFSLMVSDIAVGRGVSEEKVKSDFGQGRMLSSKAALESGMVDAVESAEMTIANAVAIGSKRNAVSQVSTVKGFEKFLRDAGFSRQKAKTYASVGYKEGQRDVDQETAVLQAASRFFG